ncbi:MAG: SH3 domain-containing protein, partial [Anaerolineales bacterium]|nr:SH3 domain-containing protein [Anaerolineales bacterium]
SKLMIKRQIVLTLTSALFLSLVVWASANSPIVYGIGNGQTIPTVTSTPRPPTNTPSGGGNGGGNNANNTPTPTNLPNNPNATPTSTLLPLTFAPTPVGGFLPTAVPCGANPTIQTLDATNVRSGPGTEYDIIGELVYLEVRYIAGRAETAAWWLIQFNNGQLGWVADEVVNVRGYTAIVPIVEAPPLNGSTPTPGALWNPTPPPFCTVTPPPTEPPTAIPAEATEATATATLPPTEPPPTEVRPTSTPIVQATAVPLNPTAAPTAQPSADEGGGGSLGLILLGAAAILGAGIFFFFRQQQD